MPATEPSAVEVSGLVVRYGAVVAVAGVDLRACRGEVVAVLGRNGAGKTSTIEAVEGYRHASAGTIRVLGLDPQRANGLRGLTRRMGIMLQRGGVYPAMGAAEALRLFASYYDDPEDADHLLERLGLSGTVARTPWRRLSGGEQQRLSLALALIGRPDVVFLDEPTAGVDAHGRQIIRAVVAELRAARVCVVLTTHELDEAERMADRVVIIDRGRVVAAGTPGQLTVTSPSPRAGGARTARATGPTGSTAPPAEIRFAAPPGLDTAALGTRLGAEVSEATPGEYRVAAPGQPATVAALTAWLAEHDIPLLDLRAGRHRLEDVFLRLTAGDPASDTAGQPADHPAGDTTDHAAGHPAGDTTDHPADHPARHTATDTTRDPPADRPDHKHP
jgi:ABC-2 type transport system ATP-binding protein